MDIGVLSGLAPDYVSESEDPRSLALTSIDPAQIRLELLTEFPGGKKPTDISQCIRDRLADLGKGGYAVLDAKAFEALYRRSSLIPV